MKIVNLNLMEVNGLIWIGLFFTYLVFDILYVQYILCVSKLNAFQAANIGVIMYFLTAFGTIQYVSNFINIIPIIIGSWLGTYFTLKYEIRRKDKDKKKRAVKRPPKFHKLF
jgi:hypothetical protein